MSKPTKIEKLGRHASLCNAQGEVLLSGLHGKVSLVRAKLDGTKLVKVTRTSATLLLPEGTRPGFGGTNVLEDDAGEFRVSAIMPGEVLPEDL